MPRPHPSPPSIARRTWWLTLAPGLLSASIALAFDIPWSSIDSGSQRAQSTSFELRGTVGQVDASALQQSSSFELRAGFHRRTPVAAQPDAVFANSFE